MSETEEKLSDIDASPDTDNAVSKDDEIADLKKQLSQVNNNFMILSYKYQELDRIVTKALNP